VTIESRQQLLRLLDALCDERASQDDFAQIEALVLADSQARQLYVEYLTLHGNLTWDVGLGGAPASPRVRTADADRHRKFRRWSAAIASMAAAVLVVLLTVVFRPTGPVDPNNLAHNTPQDLPGGESPLGPGSPAMNPGDGRQTVPVVIPPIQLTPRTTPKPGDILVSQGADSGSGLITKAGSVDLAGVTSVINRELAAGWKANDLKPSQVAEDSEWVRRVYLDIAGHIPDVDSVQRFLSDARPDKRQRLVESLLAEPDYTRHFATLWTNLLIGRSSTAPVDRTALSRFLRHQFHENRPWSETVGDLISAEGSEQQNGAAGFLLAHLNNEAVPATAITSRLFLCTQVHCTQCHKHPVTGAQQDEFWAMNSFFQQTKIEDREVVDPVTRQTRKERALVNKPEGGPTYYEDLRGVVRVAYPKFEGREVSPDGSVNRRHELARLLAAGDKPQLARGMVNRMWAHFFGHGFTNPVDDMGPHTPVSHPELLDELTESFVASGYDVKQLVRWICTSEAYQLTSEFGAGNRNDDPVDGELPQFSRMYVKPLSAEQMFDSLLVATGADRSVSWNDVDKKRQVWLDQFYASLENDENSESTTFDGSFAQSLMMMNGDLIRQAVSGAPGTSLYEVMNGPGDDSEKVRRLCLTALSRQPTRKELTKLVEAVRRYRKDNRQPSEMAAHEGLSDILWAYLNSSEFAVNH
jgi:hypothetical protein